MEELKKARTVAARRVTVRRNRITALTLDRKNEASVEEEMERYHQDFEHYRLKHESLLEVIEDDDIMDHEDELYTKQEAKTLEFVRSIEDWLGNLKERKPFVTPQVVSGAGTSSSLASTPSSSTVTTPVTLPASPTSTLGTSSSSSTASHVTSPASSSVSTSVTSSSSSASSSVSSATPTHIPAPVSLSGSWPISFPAATSSSSQFAVHPTSTDTSSLMGLAPSSGGPDGTLRPTATPWSPRRSSDFRFPASNPSALNVSELSMHVPNPTLAPNTMHDALVTALSLPAPDIEPFKGDIDQYRMFITAFDARIGQKPLDDHDKLYYLNQFLRGDPRELISGCFHDVMNGYTNARQMLEKEYGHPYKLAMFHVNKINSWPHVKADDSQGLTKFACFLNRSFNALNGIMQTPMLDHPTTLLSIVGKLPSFLQNKWREKAHSIASLRAVLFSDLMHFVDNAAQVASDPIFGQGSLHRADRDSRSPKGSHYALGHSTHITAADECKCTYCGATHKMDACPAFSSISMDERRNFVKRNRLCFACFSTGHMSRKCVARLSCAICSKKHPTVLHDDSLSTKSKQTLREATLSANAKQPSAATPSHLKQGSRAKDDPPALSNSCVMVPAEFSAEDIPSTSSCASDASKSHCFLPILPVRIRQNGSQSFLAYALYDSGSSGCFITSRLFDRLQPKATSTHLRVRTVHGSTVDECMRVDGLVVSDSKDQNAVHLPPVFTRAEIPFDCNELATLDKLETLPFFGRVRDELPPSLELSEIDILIGSNCARALEPLCVISDPACPIIGVQLRHGWTFLGAFPSVGSPVSCHRAAVQYSEVMTPRDAMLALERDFIDHDADGSDYSRDDKKFLDLVTSKMSHENGRYVIPLPFKEHFELPNNRAQAYSRLMWQRNKMQRNHQYYEDYVGFMNKLFEKGYCEPADVSTQNDCVWYLPHHGVYNANKPKIRVVFDCSARMNGISLNDCLFQGPDFLNNLVGVLTRFREGPVAFMADIEAMYYQVRVPPAHRSFLRFLWWPNGDLSADVREYQMCVHIFGAISSPSVANWVIRDIGVKSENPEIAATLTQNFYMDDCLKSTYSSESAISLIQSLCHSLASFGFRLTKFTSNDCEVLQSVPSSERVGDLQFDLSTMERFPSARALGVIWDIESDTFGCRVRQEQDAPSTRRGLLSVVSGLFDPLGIVSPVLLVGKRILQDLCRQSYGWDDAIPQEMDQRWSQWVNALPALESLKLERCFSKQPALTREFHVFSDASCLGYGAVIYLRCVQHDGTVRVSFVLGKSRLAPMRPVTIPRLELTAAFVAVRLFVQVRKEMAVDIPTFFYTDSMVTLHYIRAEDKRFSPFVANRVRTIRDHSEPVQWRHVPSKFNPADEASRGLSAARLHSSAWLRGPVFLESRQIDCTLFDETKCPTVSSAALELQENRPAGNPDPIQSVARKHSSWHSLKKAIAWMLLVKERLKSKIKGIPILNKPSVLSVMDLQTAEHVILMSIQRSAFPDDFDSLTSSHSVNKSSPLRSLDPCLIDGLICVGGRLSQADLPEAEKHPIILPRRHHITDLLIRHEHARLAHAGRAHLLASLRKRFWIVHGNAAVRAVLYRCVLCRRARRPPEGQKMADLPGERTDAEPPFTSTGVDIFGPFHVKNRRTMCKRYGVVFTCLASRAVHLETCASLETDSFVNAMRRFIARRGMVKKIFCDNGTNFKGAQRELLLQNEIEWCFNPPSASHMGGIWERMIRSVRSVLHHLTHDYGEILDDESLSTVLCEAEAIINSRPLSMPSDSDDLPALTPNHLLTLKPCGGLAPKGIFTEELYSRKRWKRVQHVADVFWSRWKREYLSVLQLRQKWFRPKRNLTVGDLVLVVEDSPRSVWPLARVVQSMTGSDGLVRSVRLRMRGSELVRPVHKCVLVLEA